MKKIVWKPLFRFISNNEWSFLLELYFYPTLSQIVHYYMITTLWFKGIKFLEKFSPIVDYHIFKISQLF